MSYLLLQDHIATNIIILLHGGNSKLQLKGKKLWLTAYQGMDNMKTFLPVSRTAQPACTDRDQPTEADCTALEDCLSVEGESALKITTTKYISVWTPQCFYHLCLYASQGSQRSWSKAGSWPTTLIVISYQPLFLAQETVRGYHK